MRAHSALGALTIWALLGSPATAWLLESPPVSGARVVQLATTPVDGIVDSRGAPRFDEGPARIRGTATIAEEDRFFAVLVAESGGRTDRGNFHAGQVLDPEATVVEGAFRNHSGGAIELIDAAGRSLLMDEGRTAILVADLDFCKVRCQQPYFACCAQGWFSKSCRCLGHGSSDEHCDHGGMGARFCSLGAD